MTIWILAILVVASTAGMGIRQGGIRAAFAFVGIVLGALLAVPLSPLVHRGLVAIGVKSEMALWLVPPAIVFLVISAAFRGAAYFVHHKVEMHYKYKVGDLRYTLWERLNHRTGLCIGVLNGTVYLVLISFLIYLFSYWTVQFTPQDPASNPRLVRLLNRMGWDLQSTGLSKVALAIDRMPPDYYQAADLLGLLYCNQVLESRLSLYPPFLGMAEQPEFQGPLNDAQLTALWQRKPPVGEWLSYPAIQNIANNRDLRATLWSTVKANLGDLMNYLKTGKSAKYDSEPLLGRWDFDVNGALALVRRTKPTISPKEMLAIKTYMTSSFSKTVLVAMTDQQILFKNYPHVKITPGSPPVTESLNVPGQWRSSEGKYALTYTVDGRAEESTASIEGDRVTVTGQGLGMVFIRED
jgi:hypothetical protein